MATIRPNAEPAATVVAGGDIFLIDGATGVRALAATSVAVRDANGNIAINNVVEGYTTTATAAGTTVLTVASTRQQFFTGTTTQTVTLPVTSTLALGQFFFFKNNSTGIVTIQSSGANTVIAIPAGASARVECILLTGTTAASWDVIISQNLIGTTTNDNAAAGNIGEYVESVVVTGSAVALTTATAKDITTITLTAGDWDVDAVIYFLFPASTSITVMLASISETLNTADFTPGKFNEDTRSAYVPGATAIISVTIPPYRRSLAGSTTEHLVASATFTASTLSAYGIIRARRVR